MNQSEQKRLNELIRANQQNPVKPQIILEKEPPITLNQRLNMWKPLRVKLTSNDAAHLHHALKEFLNLSEEALTSLPVAEQLATLYMLERLRQIKQECYVQADTGKNRLLKLNYQDAYALHKVLSFSEMANAGHQLYQTYYEIDSAIMSHLPPCIAPNITQLTTVKELRQWQES